MRRMISVLLVFLFIFSFVPDGLSSSATGEHQLELSVSFEKNALFSKYDVLVYLDNDLIAHIPHGTDYTGSHSIQSGIHILTFKKEDDSSVDGSYPFTVSSDLLLSCSIQSKRDKIDIMDPLISTKGEPDGSNLFSWLDKTPVDRVVEINGKLQLNLLVFFEKNNYFSKYNTQVFCDDVLLTTLANGEDYNAVLGISPGVHIISFVNEGNSSVKGISQINVTSDMFYSCNIENKLLGIEITEEMIGKDTRSSQMTSEDYIAASKYIDHEEISRYPEKYDGIRIRVSGKVIQAQEGLFHIRLLLIQDAAHHNWEVYYYRPGEEARIIVGDNVTIYGECLGVVNYTNDQGAPESGPFVKAEYYTLDR